MKFGISIHIILKVLHLFDIESIFKTSNLIWKDFQLFPTVLIQNPKLWTVMGRIQNSKLQSLSPWISEAQVGLRIRDRNLYELQDFWLQENELQENDDDVSESESALRNIIITLQLEYVF